MPVTIRKVADKELFAFLIGNRLARFLGELKVLERLGPVSGHGIGPRQGLLGIGPVKVLHQIGVFLGEFLAATGVPERCFPQPHL